MSWYLEELVAIDSGGLEYSGASYDVQLLETLPSESVPIT